MIELKTIIAIVTFLLSTWLANPANKHIESIAVDLIRYGKEYNVDPVLLAVMAFHESSCRTDRVGALGEIGMFQVHGHHLKTCKAAGINPIGVECGAMLIDMDRRFCGSIEHGLWRYMSGSCKGTPRAKRKTKQRLNKVVRIKEKFK